MYILFELKKPLLSLCPSKNHQGARSAALIQNDYCVHVPRVKNVCHWEQVAKMVKALSWQ
jgi:hypothetical protein